MFGACIQLLGDRSLDVSELAYRYPHRCASKAIRLRRRDRSLTHWAFDVGAEAARKNMLVGPTLLALRVASHRVSLLLFFSKPIFPAF